MLAGRHAFRMSTYTPKAAMMPCSPDVGVPKRSPDDGARTHIREDGRDCGFDIWFEIFY